MSVVYVSFAILSLMGSSTTQVSISYITQSNGFIRSMIEHTRRGLGTHVFLTFV